MSETMVAVGKLRKPRGIKGEIYCHPLTDFVERFGELESVVLEFEDAFDIEIADEDVDAVETVGNAVDLILSKQG